VGTDSDIMRAPTILWRFSWLVVCTEFRPVWCKKISKYLYSIEEQKRVASVGFLKSRVQYIKYRSLIWYFEQYISSVVPHTAALEDWICFLLPLQKAERDSELMNPFEGCTYYVSLFTQYNPKRVYTCIFLRVTHTHFTSWY